MDEADDDYNSRRLIQRLLQLKNDLDAGADPLRVDRGCIIRGSTYLDSVLPDLRLPSDALVRALGDALDGGHDAYLNRPRDHRPSLERRLDLMAGVAFAMEMLITTAPSVFQPREAAQLIADKLNAAGISPPGGRSRREEWKFTTEIVTKWHHRVVIEATLPQAPERQMYEALAKNPAHRPLERAEWDQQRRENERKAWLDRFIGGMSREYFSGKL